MPYASMDLIMFSFRVLVSILCILLIKSLFSQMLLSRARRWPTPSMPLTRFFIFFFIIFYLLLGVDQMLLSSTRRQPISSIALTRFFIFFIVIPPN